MDTLQGKSLINRDNKHFDSEMVLKERKIIVYFFSAQWCTYGPIVLAKLKRIYEESKKHEVEMEVIFVSFDVDHQSMLDYFQSQGNWYALTYGDNAIGELKYKYNITFIPYIIVTMLDGTIISKKGISEIETLGLNVLVTWNY